MLFNSYEFLFGFLPITLTVYFVLGRIRIYWAAAWLALASVGFYGFWDLRYVPLLLGSICFNFLIGGRIHAAAGSSRASHLLIFGVFADLGLLGYFKYTDFFLGTFAAVTNTPAAPMGIILPLGISFFTFTQIAYLADARIGKAREYSLMNYILFVTYFPHLIAGPILHHREMMPQFGSAETYKLQTANLSVGSLIFIIGLAKKVLIADNLAPHANELFGSPGTPSFFLSWGGVLAYTFQLYFDFSGYSDMAIGLSRMFGVQLPLNFNSPYKSTSISEFWHRWHMTLSRFLRDYLYFTLGGNRNGPARRYGNLMLTMLLGGLWHGAGWTYVVWGGLHGIYLVIDHCWREWRLKLGFSNPDSASGLFAWGITFLSVVVAWVFFRATTFNDALIIVRGMTGQYGIALPQSIAIHLGPLQDLLKDFGITNYLGGGTKFMQMYLWIVFAAVLAFVAPNTQQIAKHFEPALGFGGMNIVEAGIRFHWRPTFIWAVCIGLLAAASILSLSRPTEFLYFQF